MLPGGRSRRPVKPLKIYTKYKKVGCNEIPTPKNDTKSKVESSMTEWKPVEGSTDQWDTRGVLRVFELPHRGSKSVAEHERLGSSHPPLRPVIQCKSNQNGS